VIQAEAILGKWGALFNSGDTTAIVSFTDDIHLSQLLAMIGYSRIQFQVLWSCAGFSRGLCQRISVFT